MSSGTILDAELLLWLRQHRGRWAVFSAAFHHAERAPRVTSSLTAESPTIRSFFNHPGCRYKDSRHPCPTRKEDSYVSHRRVLGCASRRCKSHRRAHLTGCTHPTRC